MASPSATGGRVRAFVLVGAVTLLLVACSGADEPVTTKVLPGFDPAARQELLDQGVGKYLGQFSPSKVDRYSEYDIYTYDPDPHGPICLQGGPYRVSVQDHGSDDLLIFLQGGGACWTGNCAANTEANAGIYPLAWTDGNARDNPLGSYNIVFLAYCDGSVFTGDGEVPDPDNGAPNGIRYQHGLENLSAGLDLARKLYPNPKKIVLAGISAGGYGTIMGTAVTRLEYPHTRLYVINDAGVGLATPEVFAAATKEWRVLQFVPRSCKGCDQGQFTPLIAWGLQHDPTLKVGAFSAYEDAIIGGAYLGLSGPDFKALLLRETGKVHDAYPKRFERFFIEGVAHTSLMAGFYTVQVDGVTLPEWTRRMINDQPGWNDLLENGGN